MVLKIPPPHPQPHRSGFSQQPLGRLGFSGPPLRAWGYGLRSSSMLMPQLWQVVSRSWRCCGFCLPLGTATKSSEEPGSSGKCFIPVSCDTWRSSLAAPWNCLPLASMSPCLSGCSSSISLMGYTSSNSPCSLWGGVGWEGALAPGGFSSGGL